MERDEIGSEVVQVVDERGCLICRESKKVLLTNLVANITENNEARYVSSDILAVMYLICLSSVNTLDDDRERKLILDEVKFTGTEIGGGAYGRLFEVEYEGTFCTAREVDSLQSISIFAQGDDKVLQDSFLIKYHTWSTLHHPCIVQFIGMIVVIVFTIYLIYTHTHITSSSNCC